jgi:hypothetical protein
MVPVPIDIADWHQFPLPRFAEKASGYQEKA